MENILDSVSIPRRTMVLFFVVDASGSMQGSKIGAVNSAIEDVLPELADISAENADAQIKIAVLEFSSGARWLTNTPIEAEMFTWSYINDAQGLTDLGEACKQLNAKLSRNEFMNEVVGSFAPAIFLMSDGAPTDDYKRELQKLWQNNWFKKAIKVAVAIGDDADTSVLAEFTGNVESVLTVHTPETLKKMIRFVSVTASQIGSKSSNAGATEEAGEIRSKQDDMIAELNNLSEEDLDGADDGGLAW